VKAEGRIRSVLEVMSEKYRGLVDWLHQYDLGSDEIKETSPGLYLDILDCIQKLDDAFFVNQDTQAFQDALERIRLLYLKAIQRVKDTFPEGVCERRNI